MSDFLPPPSPADDVPAPTPPGWYHDGSVMRWWDGSAWGPPQSRDSSDQTIATLAHLGVVMGGFILPLVLYLISDDEKRPETRYHAREALNFQLTFLIVQVLAYVPFFWALFRADAFDPDAETVDFGDVAPFLAIAGVAVLVAIGVTILGIVAAVKANRGERYRYPICIRFVRS